MAKIFISYRRQDARGSAGRLAEDLESFFTKKQIFRDVSSIEDGEDYTDIIKRELKSCAVLIAVIGEYWLNAVDAKGQSRLSNANDWVRLEIDLALQRNIRVIPVLVDNALMPEQENLPETLKPLALRQSRQISDSRWNDDVKGLVRAIAKILGWKWRMRVEWLLTPQWMKWVGGLAIIAIILGLVSAINPRALPWHNDQQEINIQNPPISYSNQKKGTDFAIPSTDGLTLFVAPYKFSKNLENKLSSQKPNNANAFNEEFNNKLSNLLNAYLNGLNENNANQSIELPTIGTRPFEKDPDISPSDYEMAKRYGDDLNALGIVTGTGEIDKQSGESDVTVKSTFFIIPQNEQFHDRRTKTITFENTVPISEPAQDMKLIGSWGHIAILAYAVKEFEKIKVEKNTEPEKLEKLKNLINAVRSEMKKDDALIEPVNSLLTNIEKLLVEKNVKEKP